MSNIQIKHASKNNNGKNIPGTVYIGYYIKPYLPKSFKISDETKDLSFVNNVISKANSDYLYNRFKDIYKFMKKSDEFNKLDLTCNLAYIDSEPLWDKIITDSTNMSNIYKRNVRVFWGSITILTLLFSFLALLKS